MGLAVALAVVYVTTPLAIRVAARLAFYDHPIGYKGHARPTPYLGGAAVVAGFVASIALVTGDWHRTLPLVTGVLILWAVGTLDDRRTVTPAARLAIESTLAAGMWALGLGWDLGAGPAVDLVVTVVWVVAVVNAFNIFDNMDGAACSVAAVAAGGLSLFGIVEGDAWLALAGAALCGACAGFLPHNLLRSPARIFLGDGGSLPIGFAIAALAMEGIASEGPAWQTLAMGLLFVGIPALDTALVIVSRRRRGLSVATGGRDHLTHRLRRRVGTARAVAVTVGSAQATVSVLAVVAIHGVPPLFVPLVAAYLVLAGVGIAVLDAHESPTAPDSVPRPVSPEPTSRPAWPALAPLVATGLALGISPFFFGYYDAKHWVPAGLGLVVIATAGAIARPPRLSRPAWLVLAGLAGLGVVSLLSAAWTESIQSAVIGANRWLVYLVIAAALLVLVRGPRAAVWLVATVAGVALVVAGAVIVRMLDGDLELFLGGRLHEPLGYINGQAAFFLLALWPALALAERARSVVVGGAGMAAAVIFAALALLSQSRGVALAAGLSAVVVLAAVPGRQRRAWALIVVAAGVAVAAPALLEVYSEGTAFRLSGDTLRSAGLMTLVGAGVAGVLWGALRAGAAAALRATPAARQASVAALAAIALAGVVIGLANVSRIADTVDRQYTAFVELGTGPGGTEAPETRLASGSGNRYDYWRVAWGAWRDLPIGGVGAGNFDQAWFAERSVPEDVRQPHSLQLQVLSELGLLGAAFLLVLLGGLVWAAVVAARAARTSRSAAALAVAGIGMLAAWLVHTSVDWLHLIPGVTGVALVGAVALLQVRGETPATGREAVGRRGAPAAGAVGRVRGAAGPGAVGRVRGAAGPGAVGRPRTLVTASVVGLMLAVVAVSLARQGLADHFRRQAQAALAQDPAAALRDADRSLRLDGEAVRSYYIKAAALARFDRGQAARAALLAAAAREPRNFLTWALLGDLATRLERPAEARRHYRRALELNPREPSLQALARNSGQMQSP
jgi:UDP-GlcNAc:undecaprenyl-phosphate/decaprenyl-phosphate GlcNAc-1-phosphate transferase